MCVGYYLRFWFQLILNPCKRCMCVWVRDGETKRKNTNRLFSRWLEINLNQDFLNQTSLKYQLIEAVLHACRASLGILLTGVCQQCEALTTLHPGPFHRVKRGQRTGLLRAWISQTVFNSCDANPASIRPALCVPRGTWRMWGIHANSMTRDVLADKKGEIPDPTVSQNSSCKLYAVKIAWVREA